MQACRRGQVQPYNDRKGGQQHPVSGQVRSLHLDDPPMPHAHTTSKHRTNTSLGVAGSAARALARCTERAGLGWRGNRWPLPRAVGG